MGMPVADGEVTAATDGARAGGLSGRGGTEREQVEIKVRMPADLADWLAGYAERAGERNTRGEPNRTWAVVEVARLAREREAMDVAGGGVGLRADDVRAVVEVALTPVQVEVATTLRLATEVLACAMGQHHFQGRDSAGARERMNGYRGKVRERLGLPAEEL